VTVSFYSIGSRHDTKNANSKQALSELPSAIFLSAILCLTGETSQVLATVSFAPGVGINSRPRVSSTIITTHKSVALGGATTARRKDFLVICGGKLRGLAQIVKIPTYLAFCHRNRGYALGAIGGSSVNPLSAAKRAII
jgi:hypothetical protein